jgi:hypothetical protein
MKILAFPLPQVKSIMTENDDSRTMKLSARQISLPDSLFIIQNFGL